MLICSVVGHVWATKKKEDLNGHKLMIVKEYSKTGGNEHILVAADLVGAGVGENVLVVTGSTARTVSGKNDVPVDSAIVGIIDSMEML